MQLRRFTDIGMRAFQDALAKLRIKEASDLPEDLLESPDFTEAIGSSVLHRQSYRTRLDLASAICSALDDPSVPGESMADGTLWAWLSAAHFDTVCPKRDDGTRKPGVDYRHIPATGFRHFYRHLIRGPVRIYRIYEHDLAAARIILCQHPSIPGDFVEQLAARQERVTNPAVIGAATKLYFDEEKLRPKHGAAPTERHPGTLRRFIDVLDQLDLTYDLYGMTADQLLSLLPTEFDRFR